jgi:uncharacterized protein YjbI with pentapeptide repeats
MKLKGISFHNCSLLEVDFSEADLTSAFFDECDLLGAVFDNTILEKADLSKAYNYSIQPERNRIKKAKFSQSGLSGLLQHWGIDIKI